MDDVNIRPAYYKLIEECVSQIVLHKSGYDPDFRATKRFQIDVEPLIENLVKSGLRQSGISDEESKKIKQELEEALTAKQESEAKLSALQANVFDWIDRNLKMGGQEEDLSPCCKAKMSQ